MPLNWLTLSPTLWIIELLHREMMHHRVASNLAKERAAAAAVTLFGLCPSPGEHSSAKSHPLRYSKWERFHIFGNTHFCHHHRRYIVRSANPQLLLMMNFESIEQYFLSFTHLSSFTVLIEKHDPLLLKLLFNFKEWCCEKQNINMNELQLCCFVYCCCCCCCTVAASIAFARFVIAQYYCCCTILP